MPKSPKEEEAVSENAQEHPSGIHESYYVASPKCDVSHSVSILKYTNTILTGIQVYFQHMHG